LRRGKDGEFARRKRRMTQKGREMLTAEIAKIAKKWLIILVFA
jgi:hypothetical protein